MARAGALLSCAAAAAAGRPAGKPDHDRPAGDRKPGPPLLAVDARVRPASCLLPSSAGPDGRRAGASPGPDGRLDDPERRVSRVRADQLLVARGLAESRTRAQALILAGKVFAGEKRVNKSGDMLAEDAELKVKGRDHPWVSRGGVKLDHGLA